MKVKTKVLATSCILATSLIATSNVFAKNNITISRLAGEDRYSTSSVIVNKGWNQSNYAVLVNGENFPDAITASPLAKKYNAPILLTSSNVLTDATNQELQKLGVKNVYIIGGTGVISSKIENTLKDMGISVKRIYGQNRYETSVNVAKELGISNGMFVVSGEHYEDALSVAPIAAKLQYPIILISGDSVPNIVKNYVDGIKNNGVEIDVVGGSDTLNNTAVNELNPTIVYNQSSKYDRNLVLITDYKGQLDFNTMYISSDKGFSDALSGSALAGPKGNPIILVGDDNQGDVSNFINNNTVSNLNILGGTGVLSDNTVDIITGKTETDSTNSSDISDKTTTAISNNVASSVVSKVTFDTKDYTTMVTVKLNVSDPTNYTVTVKGVTATFDAQTNLFEAAVDETSNTNGSTFKPSDIVVIKNSALTTKYTISKINNINAVVNQNDIYSLPSTIQATMDDGSIQQVAVTWDNPVDTSQAGVFTFNGNVHGYSSNVNEYIGNVVLTLNVRGIINKVINFPDEKLEILIRSVINKPTGDIYKYDVQKITTLDSLSYEIKDLSGIENLTNLQSLTLASHALSDISSLKGLNNLRDLTLSFTQVSDISSLQKLTHLATLWLVGNQISDISALEELTNLQTITADNNKISDVSALKGLTNLRDLDLNDNQISDITGLEGLINLRSLSIFDNKISTASEETLKKALPNCNIAFQPKEFIFK